MCIAEIGVGAAFGRLVAELARNLEPFEVAVNGSVEVAEQIVRIAQVAVGSSLGRALFARDQLQRLVVVVHGLE